MLTTGGSVIQKHDSRNTKHVLYLFSIDWEENELPLGFFKHPGDLQGDSAGHVGGVRAGVEQGQRDDGLQHVHWHHQQEAMTIAALVGAHSSRRRPAMRCGNVDGCRAPLDDGRTSTEYY